MMLRERKKTWSWWTQIACHGIKKNLFRLWQGEISHLHTSSGEGPCMSSRRMIEPITQTSSSMYAGIFPPIFGKEASNHTVPQLHSNNNDIQYRYGFFKSVYFILFISEIYTPSQRFTYIIYCSP